MYESYPSYNEYIMHKLNLFKIKFVPRASQLRCKLYQNMYVFFAKTAFILIVIVVQIISFLNFMQYH